MTPNETLDSLIHLYAQLAIAAPAISGMVLALIGILRDRPENLHDYQGCARDSEVCECGHSRRCHYFPEGCDDGCQCKEFRLLDMREAHGGSKLDI